MSTSRWIANVSILAVAAILGCGSALAQQATGAPGSPAATTTIDGRYLPPPPQPFQGEIADGCTVYQHRGATFGRRAARPD
jgi:arylsulfatase